MGYLRRISTIAFAATIYVTGAAVLGGCFGPRVERRDDDDDNGFKKKKFKSKKLKTKKKLFKSKKR